MIFTAIQSMRKECTMTMEKIDLYTDGSCLQNPNGPGGCAAILRFDKNGKPYEKRKSAPYQNVTNNQMEIMAVIMGFELLPKTITKQAVITVYSDSKYVVDAFQKRWIVNWQKMNWDRGSLGGPVKNADLWRQLLTLVKPYRVRFVWVKGHNGNSINEECDKMAMAAAKMQKGAYRERVVKELPFKEQKNDALNMKFEYSSISANEFSLEEQLKQHKDSFIIIPTGSLNAETKVGSYQYVLLYQDRQQIYEGTIAECSSVNEVLLYAIKDGIRRIRYQNHTIVVFSGTILGFKNPAQSIYQSDLQEIFVDAQALHNQIYVLEVLGSMKSLKKYVRKKREEISE